MSSAALQTPTHQPTALASSSLTASSNRQYAPSHPPNVEANNAYQAPPAANSTTSRRPPSRKTSGNGYDPTRDPNPAVTARSGMPYQTSRNSPPQDRMGTMPPVAPPRTSSNQQGGSSRRNNYSSDRASHASRHGQPDSSRSGSRADTNGGAENGHRSKRGANSHFAQDVTGRTVDNRDNRAPTATMPIRTQQTSPPKPSREATESHPRDTQTAYAHADDAVPPPIGTNPAGEERKGGRSRHDYSGRSHKGTAKFGDFILGNTIGEGEFGKVKLGWKQDSSVQVAIKLIKRDTVGSVPTRLAKIRREVTILRELQHPNIVQLIDMVETDRYIGIILEYASGGELFDYILNHRYLKDQAARRLFAQLVSGVGYLHKKGIVHRDLKLENLLLDRNRNIIITDFGFANTFDPNEELGDEEEANLTDREFVKRTGLDKVKSNGMRKGDLMQTSCGSPCYAAPELVVSDCLYTGRKVDVWSCGVILYAMLAGYLPFDDDPANPEGDNINLLYKYIVSTPLTFPEYVTPHARDLLRRILVPNPRKRADLFEVARHSWLSDYSHVVEFITSSTTLPADVQKTITSPEEFADAPLVVRSSSVREAHRQKPHSPTSVGGLSKAHGKIDAETELAQRTTKDAKRRTVQVEYVAPTTQTQRGADGDGSTDHRVTSYGRGDAQGSSPKDKPLPRDPPVSRDGAGRPSSSRQPQSSQRNAAPPRGPREQRPITENFYMPTSTSGAARPQTGGSMSSAASMGLQSMGHYGQLAPPAVADTNVEGRMAQRSNAEEVESQGRPSIGTPSQFARMSGMNQTQGPPPGRGHKRSSTIGDIGSKLLGRSGSMFSGRGKKRAEQQGEKSRKYPPVSMTQPIAAGEESRPRQSMDSRASRRSFSLGLGKKRSGSMTGSQGSGEKSDRRRFSLLPPSFSLKAIGLGKEAARPASETGSQSTLPTQEPPRSFTAYGDARGSSPIFDPVYNNRPQASASNPARHQRHASAQLDNRRPNAIPPHLQSGTHYNAGSDSSIDMRRPPTEPQMTSYQRPYEQGYADSEVNLGQRTESPRGNNRVVLQKNAKKFTDAYEQDDYRGHEGSTGAAKRVMDFFRRRGKARGGEDR